MYVHCSPTIICYHWYDNVYSPKPGPSLGEIEDLSWVQKPLEDLHQFSSLVTSALGVDEDKQWLVLALGEGFYLRTRESTPIVPECTCRGYCILTPPPNTTTNTTLSPFLPITVLPPPLSLPTNRCVLTHHPLSYLPIIVF